MSAPGGITNPRSSGRNLNSFSPAQAHPAGEIPSLPRGQWYRGVVIDVNPATFTIDVDVLGTGHTFHDVPILSQTGDCDFHGGTSSLPKVGAMAVVSTQLKDEPAICVGFINASHENPPPNPTDEQIEGAPLIETVMEATAPTASEDYGGNDPLYRLKGGESFSAGRARDIAPGDWQQVGSEGNSIAILDGGVSIFKASDLAQILGFKLGDLIRIVARNFELMTDFGILRMVSDGGRAKLTLEANTDTLLGHPAKDGGSTWNIVAALGDEDNALELKFNDNDNNETASVIITNEGDITLSGRSVQLRSGRLQDPPSGAGGTQNVTGHNMITKLSGNDTKEVLGDTELTSRDITLDSGRKFKIRAKSYTVTTTDIVENVSHKAITTVQGAQIDKDGPPAPYVHTAKEVNVVNGDYVIAVGDPSKLGVPTYISSFYVQTYTGSVAIQATLKGSVVISSGAVFDPLTSPFGVVIGGSVSNKICLGAVPAPKNPTFPLGVVTPVVAVDPVVKFNELLIYLSALHTALDTHIHGTGVGPSSPAVVPFTPTLSGLTAAIASQVVMVSL